jgi:hypothetical protein
MAPTDPTAGFGLDPEFAATLVKLLARCKTLGLDFRISQGLRTPQTQAEYYCKWDQRSPKDIDKAVKSMQDAGAPWLASLLHDCRDIKRQAAWVTSQLPGSGWHQWGEAADIYCYRKGKMVEDGNDPCYKQYPKPPRRSASPPGCSSRIRTPVMCRSASRPARPTSSSGRRSTRS